MTIASDTTKQQHHDASGQESGATTSTATPEHGGHKTKFTNDGVIPPVAGATGAAGTADDGGGGLSASDRAFGHVTADALNVRSSPAKVDDNIIGGLHGGAKVATRGQHGSWLEIEHAGGPAFVHGAFVHVDGKGPVAPKDGDAHHETQPKHAESKGADGAHADPKPAAANAAGGNGHIGDGGPLIAHPEVAHADTTPTTPITTTPPTTTPPTTTPTTASATPHAIQHPGAATFETIQHTRVEINHDDEGKQLSDIRAFEQQFDPHWLIQIQVKLQVGDATGAFNTETLRAIRDVSNNQKLTGKKIANHAFLLALGKQLGVEGEPFRPKVTGMGNEAADPSKTSPADLAAQAVGYADYHAYRTETMKKTKFLDVDLEQGTSDGRAHPLLRARIEAAEAYLVQRFGSKEKAITGTGWTKHAGAAYSATDSDAHDPKDPKSHMHTMGMAIDIDPNVNPYTMAKGDGEAADWRYWFYTKGFEMGSRLGFGGDELNLKSLYAEGTGMSSEELHEHMLASSHSFAQTVEMSEKSDDEIKDALLKAKYKDGTTHDDIPWLIEKWFHVAKTIYHDAKSGDRKFHETMTESKELIVALRDAGGLNWGGTEMSTGQNGDFMHFDTRNDSVGHTVYQTGYDAQQALHHKRAAEAAEAAKKAKAAKDGVAPKPDDAKK